MLIIVGIELLETIETYLTQNRFRAEVVLLVGIIVMVRKVIILDIKLIPGITMIGMAAIIIALASGYYLIKRSRMESKSKK